MELKNKLYGEYINSVVSQLKGKGLQEMTRAELYRKLEEYYNIAIENKATHEEAVRSAVVNMGDTKDLIEKIKLQHKEQLALPITIALGSVVVVAFVVMIALSHGEIFRLLATYDLLAVAALTILIALVYSVYRFTLYKFLCGLELGACAASIGYLLLRMLYFYRGNMSERLRYVEYVRGHITQMILVLIYGIAVYTAANFIKRRKFPPLATYVRNIFQEREHLRVRGGKRRRK